MTDERAPPESQAAERLLLGAIIREPEILDECSAGGLRSRHFYSPPHAALYDLLLGMSAEGIPIDPTVTVPDAVARSPHPERFGGIAYVVELPDKVPATVNYRHYCERIMEDARRRAVLLAMERAKDHLLGGVEDASRIADRVIDSLSQEGVGIRNGWQSLAGVQSAVVDEVEQQVAQGGGLRARGLSTGLYALDQVIARLQPTDLVVLAARPGMGKTALATNIAESVAAQRVIVGMFSLEMGVDQLARRALGGEAKVSGQSLRLGQYSMAELERLRAARDRLEEVARWIYVDDRAGLTISEIRGRARRLARMVGKPGLIVIDYLQLVGGELGDSANREREIAHASADAKALAKELGCAVLLLSQLNRSVETTKDHRPQLQHLRESGAIEQDADQVLFLFRPGYYKPADESLKWATEVIVAKNRHGPCKTVDVNFDGSSAKFFDLTTKQLAHGGAP